MPTRRVWIMRNKKGKEYWKNIGGILEDLYSVSSVGTDVFVFHLYGVLYNEVKIIRRIGKS
jgi:cell shape-determining protein MreD